MVYVILGSFYHADVNSHARLCFSYLML